MEVRYDADLDRVELTLSRKEMDIVAMAVTCGWYKDSKGLQFRDALQDASGYAERGRNDHYTFSGARTRVETFKIEAEDFSDVRRDYADDETVEISMPLVLAVLLKCVIGNGVTGTPVLMELFNLMEEGAIDAHYREIGWINVVDYQRYKIEEN